jgi:hypothetical protein
MRFSLDNKPADIPFFRKKSQVQLLFVTEPFEVETQEGGDAHRAGHGGRLGWGVLRGLGVRAGEL